MVADLLIFSAPARP